MTVPCFGLLLEFRWSCASASCVWRFSLIVATKFSCLSFARFDGHFILELVISC
ncbi:hypothetical protein GQ55_9G197500 [Panicum hallii var. hallii]|uniref:Uncharacterized protein n=1 Tax=Panicum hallii var. hallii TaxID=1504633 RepID=A0A2T7C528_9POAL|nr:hypothetical protein GQ55_9G197500 [Panicum hallii var. hallii]